MFETTSKLHPAYLRRFQQYAAFLESIGVPSERYAVVPSGVAAPAAEVTIVYGSDAYDDGDIVAETRVHGGRSRLIFISGLRTALFHLSWYFDQDRGSTVTSAFNASNLPDAMEMLGLDEEDVQIDAIRRRTGYMIEEQHSGTRLVLIDTHGEVVPIATSDAAATLAYVVRVFKDHQAGDIVERTARFLPKT
jgi:hypothetical protein